MSKFYKVRVNKALRKTYWYADKIGEEFIVVDVQFGWTYCLADKISNLLDKDDCEIICEVVQKTVYEDVKRKVRMYKVVYKKTNMGNDYFVTSGYYADAEDFYENGLDKCNSTFVQLIEDSMIEVEV